MPLKSGLRSRLSPHDATMNLSIFWFFLSPHGFRFCFSTLGLFVSLHCKVIVKIIVSFAGRGALTTSWTMVGGILPVPDVVSPLGQIVWPHLKINDFDASEYHALLQKSQLTGCQVPSLCHLPYIFYQLFLQHLFGPLKFDLFGAYEHVHLLFSGKLIVVRNTSHQAHRFLILFQL